MFVCTRVCVRMWWPLAWHCRRSTSLVEYGNGNGILGIVYVQSGNVRHKKYGSQTSIRYVGSPGCHIVSNTMYDQRLAYKLAGFASSTPKSYRFTMCFRNVIMTFGCWTSCIIGAKVSCSLHLYAFVLVLVILFLLFFFLYYLPSSSYLNDNLLYCYTHGWWWS